MRDRDAERPSGRVDVSVLVPVLNEEACIRDAVAAMQAQRFEGDVELLFMDGRSEDRTRAILDEIAEGDPRVRVLDNPERRTPNGLNLGLRHARGEFVARMDAHSFYPPDYLARGVERLRRGDVAWVSGPQIPEGSGRWSRLVALALGTWLGVGGSRKWGNAREIDIDTGVFTGIWRRSTLERYGGWDEGWPANQDSELAARVLADGGRIVCLPELGARYVPRDSLSSLARQYGRYGYYRARTAARHPHSLRRSHVLPPGLALALLAAVLAPRRARKPARAGLAIYGLCLAGVSASAGSTRSDLIALPAVFATMHFAWGFGFIAGCARFGLPLAGFARALTGRGKSS